MELKTHSRRHLYIETRTTNWLKSTALKHIFLLKTSENHLTHVTPLISFDTPWKQKTKGFLMFSGGIKKDLAWNGLICISLWKRKQRKHNLKASWNLKISKQETLRETSKTAIINENINVKVVNYEILRVMGEKRWPHWGW